MFWTQAASTGLPPVAAPASHLLWGTGGEGEGMLPAGSLGGARGEGGGFSPHPSTLKTWEDVIVSTSLHQRCHRVLRVAF